MKLSKYLSWALVLAFLALLGACSPRYTASFQPSTPAGYGNQSASSATVQEPEPATLPTVQDEMQPEASQAPTRTMQTTTPLARALAEQQLPKTRAELSASDQELLLELENSSLERQRQIIKAEAKRSFKQLSKTERKAMRQEFREAVSYYHAQRKAARRSPESPQRRDADSDEMFVLIIILCILLPPIGVFLHEQEFNPNFWVSLGLFALIIFNIGIGWVLSAIWSVLVAIHAVSAG